MYFGISFNSTIAFTLSFGVKKEREDIAPPSFPEIAFASISVPRDFTLKEFTSASSASFSTSSLLYIPVITKYSSFSVELTVAFAFAFEVKAEAVAALSGFIMKVAYNSFGKNTFFTPSLFNSSESSLSFVFTNKASNPKSPRLS